jgi:hypothetical protein
VGGTREEPGTLTQGGALFSLTVPLVWEPKTPGASGVCVFITAGPSTKLFAWVGGGPQCVCVCVCGSPTTSRVCVFITAVPNTKLCAWGEEECVCVSVYYCRT